MSIIIYEQETAKILRFDSPETNKKNPSISIDNDHHLLIIDYCQLGSK